MDKFKILLGLYIVFLSCNPSTSRNSNYNGQLSNLIFSNYRIKNKLISTFRLENNLSYVFKVLISRRDHFVRVTIYQIVNKDEVKEFPSSFFVYNSNTFLCYDGSEIIANKRLDDKFLDGLKRSLQSGYTNDSRVVQFDVNNEKTVKLNEPAINPYDLIEQSKTPFPLVHKDTSSKPLK